MKVTIEIVDVGDEVNVRIEFDPPVGDDTKQTGASMLAMAAMQAIREQYGEKHDGT